MVFEANYQTQDAIADCATEEALLGLDSHAAGRKMGFACHRIESFPLTLCFLLKVTVSYPVSVTLVWRPTRGKDCLLIGFFIPSRLRGGVPSHSRINGK